MILVKNLSKDFGMGFALKDINLNVVPGEKISMFGPNGAGKTTLLRILACLITPTDGSFTISGFPHTQRIQILRNIGLAAQSGHFYEALTVNQNLEFYGKMYGLEKKGLSARIMELLHRFNLSEKSNHKVNQLSKGMKQRLIIIKSLLHDPSVLLLDEPYSGLDTLSADILSNYLDSLVDKTIITATHDFDRVQQGQRIFIFNHGLLAYNDIWTGSAAKFKSFYQEVITDAH